MTTEDRPPSIEERYLTATSTTNLRVTADRSGPADILIAASWSPTRVGSALIRLHGEWDSAEKRPRMSETDYILLRAKLKSLSSVLVQVVDYMVRRGMEDPEGRAGPIVGYWLDQTCHPCHGLKFLPIRGTPALSGMRCQACHGTGKGRPPFELLGGKEVLNWMDACVGAARASIRARLRR